MTVVVAGGTGFLGRHISRALLDAGHDVTVLTRAPERVSGVALLEGAGAVRGDVTDPQSLAPALEGAEALVGCVQFPNHPVEVPRRDLTYDHYDRQGTENLLEAAQAAGVDRFVYVSGAGADSSSDKSWYRAKGRAERAIAASGLAFAILRPSWAYGPEDRALYRLAAIARWSPVVPRLGVRPQRIQPVHVDDIALAVARIFETEEAWGKTLEIGGPDVMTMDEVLRTLLRVLGKRRLIVPIPVPLAKLGTAPLVLLPKPPITPQGIEFAVQEGVVDSSELEAVLEVDPVPLEEGLRRYLPRG